MSVDLLSGNWQLQYRRPVAHNTRVSCGFGAPPRCKESSEHISFADVDHAIEDRLLKIGGQTAATANRHKGEGFLNNNASRVSNLPTMTKLIALVTAGLFAAGTMFAGEHGNCTKQIGNEAKMACTVALATLNLTPDQKTKMDAALTEHHKAGCSEASEAKYMQEAKSILTPEQYAKFNAQCKKGDKDKTQT